MYKKCMQINDDSARTGEVFIEGKITGCIMKNYKKFNSYNLMNSDLKI